MLGTPRHRPPPPSFTAGHLPAPRGVNLVDSVSALPDGDCTSLTNHVRDEYGLRSRLGYRVHNQSVIGANKQIRTLLGFHGSTAAKDKLFACTHNGIWDVTGTSLADLDHAFGVTGAETDAGYGVGRAFTSVDGKHWLLYCDEANGYLAYREDTDAWTTPTITNEAGAILLADRSKLVAVTVWKHRVWLVEKDSTVAYYLGLDAYQGEVQPFDFGAQFTRGGHLVGLYSWTRDGGNGIDDFLVALSSGGDLVVYQGTDPDDPAKFEIRGVWYIGAPPAGRHVATERGGDLQVLSTLGLLPVSVLLDGASPEDPDVATSRKIGSALGRLMCERGDKRGWATVIHPEDRTLIITVPASAGQAREQWVLGLLADGWARHTGLPMTCVEPWRGELFFGTDDGRVCVNSGDADNVGISDSSNAVAIEWSGITRYSDLGAPTKKRVLMARPHMLTTGTPPQYGVEARYDFNLSEPTTVPYEAAPPSPSSWGEADWGELIWGVGQSTAGDFRGTTGIGSHVALAWRGASKNRTTLVGFDVMFDAGGPL